MFPEPNIPASARIIFKFGAQGDAYWNNKIFISQINTAIKIAEFKYPPMNNIVVFLFAIDQSLRQCVFAHDALRAHS